MKVNIIYHHFPHYRRPVLRELVKSGVHEYRFFGSHDDISGIKAFKGDELVKINPLGFKFRGSTWVLSGYWSALLDSTADVLIVHGHPNMPASWIIGIVGRLTGKKVFYWAHGWLKKESPLKSSVRNLHYRLGNKVMTYAERARDLAAASGFPADRVVPIYNSLDWLVAREVLAGLQCEGVENVRRRIGMPTEAYVLNCVARLTDLCRFDLLLDAMSILKERGVDTVLYLVGNGPARQSLESQAESLGLNVNFMGAIYDEENLGAVIYSSDLTVSPGKVGLSAMHSMMYGTPVISHDSLDEQMPEVEAIIEGETGALFGANDALALADKIQTWITTERDRNAIRNACVRVIQEKYNPETQASIINDAITQVMKGGAT